jgi:hypothetical protein
VAGATSYGRRQQARDFTDANTFVSGGSFSHEQLDRDQFASRERIMTSDVSAGASSVFSKELQLSNGVALSNRIAQSAMTEHLATGDGAPSWQLIEAYRRFAVSGASLIISGNVMVNGWSLEAPRQPDGFDTADALIVAQALENVGVHLIEFPVAPMRAPR